MEASLNSLSESKIMGRSWMELDMLIEVVLPQSCCARVWQPCRYSRLSSRLSIEIQVEWDLRPGKEFNNNARGCSSDDDDDDGVDGNQCGGSRLMVVAAQVLP